MPVHKIRSIPQLSGVKLRVLGFWVCYSVKQLRNAVGAESKDRFCCHGDKMGLDTPRVKGPRVVGFRA